MTISDEEALALSYDDLPTYTILVPAYNEPEVVGDLIAAMRAIEYPADKMQVLLLLEEDDAVTIEAALAAGVDEVVSILKVPAADPRTKPKACNYGLQFLDGRDRHDLRTPRIPPTHSTLRRVVATFAKLPENTACVQAKTCIPQRNSEPVDRVVHRRLRAVVQLHPSWIDAEQFTDSSRRHLESPTP